MANSDRYWQLVNSLIERGITSREGWYRNDAAEYNYYWRGNKKGFRVQDILRDVVKHMSWSRTFYEYIVGNYIVGDIRANRVYRMLSANRMCPEEVGSVLLKWSGLVSPRNTIWVSGNDVTGARQFVESLVHLSPLIGRVNPDDEYNPFEAARNCLVYMWNDSKIPEKGADLCLEVFAGRHVPADGVNGEIFRTPVFVHANCDMRYIKTSNEDRMNEYFQRFEDVMFRLHFWVPQPSGFGCVTCRDMRDFMTWVSTNQVQIPDRHSLNLAVE